MKEARIAAEDADADRARTKLRRESEWMAKQPRARQAKSKARQQQFYELVDKAKGREADKAKVTNLAVHYLLRDTLAWMADDHCCLPMSSIHVLSGTASDRGGEREAEATRRGRGRVQGCALHDGRQAATAGLHVQLPTEGPHRHRGTQRVGNLVSVVSHPLSSLPTLSMLSQVTTMNCLLYASLIESAKALF